MTKLSSPNIGKVYYIPYNSLYLCLVLDIKPGFEKDVNADTITVKDLVSGKMHPINSRDILTQKYVEIEDDHKPAIIKRLFEELQ